MTATSKPDPGSRAAVLDVVVRAATEGRYRLAQLHLLWHRDRVPLEDVAEAVTAATEMPAIPHGLTADQVVARSRTVPWPDWLAPHITDEVGRIFAGQPVAGAAPVQLVARIVAAVCIDVSAEAIDAADRAARPEALDRGEPHGPVTADGPGRGVAGPHEAAVGEAPPRRLIHLGVPDTIDLDRGEPSDRDPSRPPSSL